MVSVRDHIVRKVKYGIISEEREVKYVPNNFLEFLL